MSIQLIGSRTEKQFRTELLASRESCFGPNSNSRLKEVLAGRGDDINQAIVIGWIPDQSGDFYKILLLPDTIISLEIDREDGNVEPVIAIEALEIYRRSLSKIGLINLAVAFDILENS